MPSLSDSLLENPRRDALAADIVALVEQHVSHRGGLKGLALKAGLAAARSVRPDIVPRAVQAVLPELATALEPMYQEHLRRGGRDFSDFLTRNADRTVETLLDAADRRMARAQNPRIIKTFKQLRKGGDAELHMLLPGLAKAIGRQVK